MGIDTFWVLIRDQAEYRVIPAKQEIKPGAGKIQSHRSAGRPVSVEPGG